MPQQKPVVIVVDMQFRNVSIAGQELMTRDKVTLRLSLAVDYRIEDVRRVSESVSDPQATVYLAAQLAARDSRHRSGEGGGGERDPASRGNRCTRSLANTAKVMAEQPVLLRLEELEAMKDIAERIDEVRVVVGADGLKELLPT